MKKLVTLIFCCTLLVASTAQTNPVQKAKKSTGTSNLTEFKVNIDNHGIYYTQFYFPPLMPVVTTGR